jgi:hypothetical protein
MQPASGKEKGKAKVGRRRIACTACSANKQKCDGNLRYPCRRCELYSVSCEYPDGEVPRTAVRIQTPNPEPTNAGGGGGLGAITRSTSSSDAGLPVVEVSGSETATLYVSLSAFSRFPTLEAQADSFCRFYSDYGRSKID